MNLLSAERGGSVDEEAYGQILNHLVDSKRFTFEDRYASLTEKQKTVLMAIASEFPSQVTLSINTIPLCTSSQDKKRPVCAGNLYRPNVICWLSGGISFKKLTNAA